MKLFYRRPLSLILCIMLGAFSLFSKISDVFKYILLGTALILLALSFVKQKNARISRGLVRTSIICFIISSILSHVYFNLYFKAYERFENEVSLTGTVSEINDNNYSSYLTVLSDDINSESFSRYKLLIVLDFEEKESCEIKVGNKIHVMGIISDFENEKSDFNLNSYYLSKGYSAKITEITDITASGEEKKPLTSYFSEVRHNVSEFIIENSNDEAGGLLSALLLGDKDYLSPSIELNFKRIGISHILALSGMHLAILALGLSRLLMLFGLGKKFSSYATLCFTACYMVLTGFPVSVVRAGIMLIIATLLYLLANASDSFTNLSISVFLIVLISPHSIFDISLLLSALATLGIVALGDLPKSETKAPANKNKIVNSLIISLFAISATFLISVLSFGEISLISPISTLVFSVIVEIFLYFGTLFLIFGEILPLGDILIFIGNLIKNLAEKFSDIPYITVSTEFLFIKVAAFIFTVLFFLFLILEIRRKRLGVALISSLMTLILISGAIITFSSENEERVSYLSGDSGDSVLITDGGEISLIENKTYTAGRMDETLDYLKDEKLTRLDNYVLTDYNAKMPEAVCKLLSNVKISNIYVPHPITESERTAFTKLLALKETFDVNIVSCKSNSTIKFKNFSFVAKYRDENYGIFKIFHENKKYLIASSGILDSNAKNLAISEIYNSDYIIFSRHGKSYKNYSFVYEFKNPKVIILSSKGMYISNYMLNYYKKSGAEIYLTPEKYDFIR